MQQIITGAIGFDAWEWGVTLFAKDPLDFKKLVTEMRFDEASARYVDFGEFWVGRVMTPEEWVRRREIGDAIHTGMRLGLHSAHDEVGTWPDQSGKGKVRLRWLGHAAFEIESSRRHGLLIDPFITGNPVTPRRSRTSRRYTEHRQAHRHLCTHSHGDHSGDARDREELGRAGDRDGRSSLPRSIFRRNRRREATLAERSALGT